MQGDTRRLIHRPQILHRPHPVQFIGRALVAVPSSDLATGLSGILLALGLLPAVATTVPDVLDWVRNEHFLVLIVHSTLSSHGLLAELRRRSDAPLLGIGALPSGEPLPPPRLAPDDRVPDDLDPTLLAARALALVARHRPLPPRADDTAVVTFGPLRIDPARRESFWHDQPLPLTAVQFRILLILARANGDVVLTADLIRQLWGHTPVPSQDSERLYAHIRRLRKRIEPDPTHATFLLTVRGEGFRLAAPPRVFDPPADPPPV